MDSSHRPWPVPSSPWLMRQVWKHILFVHYPIDPEMLRPHIPDQMNLDTYGGKGWVGFIFLQVNGMRLRLLPSIPFVSKYYELNVRTYVTYNHKPGVYFFSLDAENHLAVKGARIFFHLPYRFLTFTVKTEKDKIKFRCQRRNSPESFAGLFQPASKTFHSEPGSLDYWLTERYCLYTVYRSTLYRCNILHEPWPLQQAVGEITDFTMLDIEGIQRTDAPILHTADRQEALMWGLEQA